MATEELLVLLDARTAKLDAKLNATNEKLDGLSNKTDKADSGLKKFGKGAAVAGTVILKTAAAATALAGAISAIVLSSASSRRELELLSRQAKTSAEDFQALAFATSRYGINAEQIADISKDIADKVGEFSAAGTGAFQDYADVMKLSKDEARAAAQEFEGLSSQEILGRMVSRMEDASVSGDKMTFVLESLGNDASRLIPLFKGNSAELLELKKRFDDVNSSLQITGTQAEALKDVSNTFTLLTSTVGNATTAISATLAPVLDDFFNDVIDIVPDATQAIIDFANSFLDAENISSIAAVNKEIADGQERIDELTEKINSKRQRGKELIKADREIERQRLVDLKEQLEVLTAQEQKLEDVKRLEGGQIGGATGGDTGTGTGDELQGIADRFKSEEELLGEKLIRELEIIGTNDQLKLELYREFAEGLQEIKDEEAEIEADRKKKELEDYEKELAERAKLDEKAGKAKTALEGSVANNTVGLLKMVAGESKAAALLGLVVQKAAALSANATATLSGSMLAYSSQLIPGDPSSPIRAEAARNYVTGLGSLNAGLIVATGLGEAGAITSGGGGGGGGFAGGGTAPQAQQQQQDFQPETTSLQLSSATESGSTTGMIRFATDSGDELMDTIAMMLNKGQQEGRFA